MSTGPHIALNLKDLTVTIYGTQPNHTFPLNINKFMESVKVLKEKSCVCICFALGVHCFLLGCCCPYTHMRCNRKMQNFFHCHSSKYYKLMNILKANECNVLEVDYDENGDVHHIRIRSTSKSSSNAMHTENLFQYKFAHKTIGDFVYYDVHTGNMEILNKFARETNEKFYGPNWMEDMPKAKYKTYCETLQELSGWETVDTVLKTIVDTYVNEIPVSGTMDDRVELTKVSPGP